MKKLFLRNPLILAAALMIAACSNNSGPGAGDSFDRAALLLRYADSIIIPAFSRANSHAAALEGAVESFCTAPDEQSLAAAQTAWKSAYLEWQAAVAFNFGPGETLYGTLLENIGTFPIRISAGTGADSAKKGIEDYISAGDYLFQNFARDTRGFLAADYLLFSDNSAETVLKFSGAAGKNRREYLRAVARDIAKKLNEAAGGWQGYKSEFIAKKGTDAGSSISLLFNHLNVSYELIKNYKVGLPAGKRAGQTATEPTKTEAYYSGISLACIRRHFAAVQGIWYGTGSGGADGVGFEEYLAAVRGGKELAEEIRRHFAEINDALAQLPENARLSDEILQNFAKVEALHTALQKCTRFLKSDMSSLLGISITYSSNDGD